MTRKRHVTDLSLSTGGELDRPLGYFKKGASFFIGSRKRTERRIHYISYRDVGLPQEYFLYQDDNSERINFLSFLSTRCADGRLEISMGRNGNTELRFFWPEYRELRSALLMGNGRREVERI